MIPLPATLRRNTPWVCSFFLPLFLCTACSPAADHSSGAVATDAGTAIELRNEAARLRIDPNGGAFTEFVHLTNPVNPLTWALTAEQMPENNRAGAPFRGHFLCLGRWGSPSAGEIAAGIPHNGEQSNTPWRVIERSDRQVIMENDAPLDGLTVRRRVELSADESSFTVTETIRNTGSLGRPGNVVQHVTLGPPFLSGEMLVQTNATQGFNQKFCYPDPHRYAYVWPQGLADTTGTTVDLRKTSLEHNYVSTHIFDPSDTYGWITAYDPSSGLLLGYVWRLDDYPWLNVWNHQENGRPVAKGLEFGTTGIGRPYRDLLETDTRFHGHNSWEYLDAGEQIEKSFVGFILDVGTNATIGELAVGPGKLQVPVTGAGATGQTITLTHTLR